MMLGRRWADVPRAVRIIAGAEILVLGYGGVVHLVQLVAGGFEPYPWAPAWLATYFISLTVLDPFAAALLWTRRAAGLYLVVAVLVTDALANGYAVYGLTGATGVARASQVVISLLAMAALATAPRVRPWLSYRSEPSTVRTTSGP